MPVFTVDLHNHTPASADHHAPAATPVEIVDAALDAGLDVFAVTDHVSWWFVPELISAAEMMEERVGRRLLVVPGAELRVTHRGDEAHITALFDSGDYEQRLDELMGVLGLTSPCAPHRELPLFTFEHDPVEVCRAIDALGGIANVAHADRAFGTYRLVDTELFARLASDPAVAAVDLLDVHAARTARASDLGASIIRCSDSHSCEQIGSRRSLVTMDELSFASLRTALRNGCVMSESFA